MLKMQLLIMMLTTVFISALGLALASAAQSDAVNLKTYYYNDYNTYHYSDSCPCIINGKCGT